MQPEKPRSRNIVGIGQQAHDGIDGAVLHKGWQIDGLLGNEGDIDFGVPAREARQGLWKPPVGIRHAATDGKRHARNLVGRTRLLHGKVR